MKEIIFICVVTIIAIVLVVLFYKSEERNWENRKLAKFLTSETNFMSDAELRKLLSDPAVRKKAEKERDRYEEEERKREIQKRKKGIIDRCFSYEYEDLLFEVFAPFANRDRTPLAIAYCKEWEHHESLEVEFVLNEIIRISKVSNEEANQLITKFIKHRLIKLSPNEQKCCLGDVLVDYWNIVSGDDMNLTRWIQQHPERESRASAEIRRKPFYIVES